MQGRDPRGAGAVRRRGGRRRASGPRARAARRCGSTWDESRAETRGSDELYAAVPRRSPARPGRSARRDGDAAGALARRDEDRRGRVRVPVSRARADGAARRRHPPRRRRLRRVGRLADPDRSTSGGRARIRGLPPSKVRLHTLLAGGSFGRRATPDGDIAAEAAAVAKAIGGGRPSSSCGRARTTSSGGRYRPALRASPARRRSTRRATSSAGSTASSASRSSRARRSNPRMVKDGIDPTSVEGASSLPYDDPEPQRSSCTRPTVGVPVLWWRSVGSTHTAFSTETFLDELAHAARPRSARAAPRAAGQASAPSRGARTSPPRRRAGGSRCRPGARARHRGARVVRQRRRAGGRGLARGRTACRRSSASCAPSTAASPSTPTSCARRWRAASASAWRRRCGARSRSCSGRVEQSELRRLPSAAHRRDAGGRGAHRAVGRGSRRASASPACRRSRPRSPTRSSS